MNPFRYFFFNLDLEGSELKARLVCENVFKKLATTNFGRAKYSKTLYSLGSLNNNFFRPSSFSNSRVS